MRNLRIIGLIGALGAAAFALTACAGGGSAPGGDAGDEASGALLPVSIAVLDSNIASTPFQIGLQQGIFEEHGLDVTLVPGEAAALVPSVVSGASNFAFLNAPGVLIARSNDVPIVSVAATSAFAEDPASAPLQILVGGDSDITEPGDLEGRTVGVDALFQLPDMAARGALERAGVDVSKVKFTEVPFPQMLDSLDSGALDAAVAIEPFVSIGEGAGKRILLSAAEGQTEPVLPQGVVMTSEKYADANGDTVEAMQASIEEIGQYANEHDDEVRALIPTFTKVPEALAGKIRLYGWVVPDDDEGWQAWADILAGFDLIEGDIDVSDARY